MASEVKKGLTKNEIAYGLAMILGLVIGFLIKRVKIGLFIGIILSLLIGLSTIFRFTRKDDATRKR
jgi:L-cystine uptake protein TcyP (sodium:dicarboxylate symporter family)